jgi:hypothetical protein
VKERKGSSVPFFVAGILALLAGVLAFLVASSRIRLS